ncbi:ketosteroid isomerase-like protein [Devosia sp. UYZn731]|uniref:YybH family protein n=1 Tax=Devosia sp. UYZn731 TaxID=3156345 RepID=UPI003396153C
MERGCNCYQLFYLSMSGWSDQLRLFVRREGAGKCAKQRLYPSFFDLPPPLVYQGNQARDIEALDAWFATWRDGVTVHLADPHIIIDGDLAVAFGLSGMTGIKTDGTKVDSWSRRTVVLRRSVGVWKIVHEHASFPMAMDGSGRAVTDLLP